MPLFSIKKFKGFFSPRTNPFQANTPDSESQSDSRSLSSNRDRSQSTSETKASQGKHRNSISSSTPKIIISVPPSPLLTPNGQKGILIKNSFKIKSETSLREPVNPNANSRNKSTQNTPATQEPQNKKRVTFAKDVRQSANEQYINLKFVEKFHEKTGASSPREHLPSLKSRQGFASPQICLQFCPNDGFLPMSFTPKVQTVSKKSELKVDFLKENLFNEEPAAIQHNKSPKYQIIRHMESRKNSLSILPIIGSPCSMKGQNDSSSNQFTFGALTSLTPKHSENYRGSSRRSLFENSSPSNIPRHRIRASIGPIEVNDIQALRAADQKLESEFLDDQTDTRTHARLLIRKQRGSLLASSN